MYLGGLGMRRDPSKAFQLWKKLADLGSDEAQDTVGYFYLDGIGTDRDPGRAEQSFIQSANQGNKNAMSELALYYSLGFIGWRPWVMFMLKSTSCRPILGEQSFRKMGAKLFTGLDGQQSRTPWKPIFSLATRPSKDEEPIRICLKRISGSTLRQLMRTRQKSLRPLVGVTR
jgi:TPR repeat protein